MPYPDGTDLAAFLISAGVIDEAPSPITDYDAIMVAAAYTFEQDTGWLPFLNEDNQEEEDSFSIKYFDPPGIDLLPLPNGILALDYLKINDAERTENTQFWRQPYNTTPTRWIEFNACISGQPRTIAINAVWGYCSELPERVNQALLMKGAMEAAPKSWGAGGEVTKIKQGPIELEKAGASLSGDSLMDTWKEFYNCTVAQFKQVRSVTA